MQLEMWYIPQFTQADAGNVSMYTCNTTPLSSDDLGIGQFQDGFCIFREGLRCGNGRQAACGELRVTLLRANLC